MAVPAAFVPAIPDRWVLCDGCGEPLGMPVGATLAPCDTCGAETPLPPRSDAPLGGRSELDEAERIRRLREQDGQPLLPPSGLEGLLKAGEIPAYKEREAVELYLANKRELRDSTDPAAQTRLMFLTVILVNHFDDPVFKRALCETSLDAMPLQRHQQTMRGYLAREAARTGDLAAAEAWLAPCDPRSDDLEMDSTWRFTRATIALYAQDWAGVLEVLGSDPSEVPIADHSDVVTTVFRAHAHEQLGDVDRAARQLAEAMNGKRRALEGMIAHRPELKLCERSIGAARQQHAAHAAKHAGLMSGGGIGGVMLFAGLMTAGMGVVLLAVGVWTLATGGPPDEWAGMMFGGLVTLFVGGPVVGGMGLRSILKARKAARIRTHGLAATGTVLGAERTGTEINNVPQMRLKLRVELEGREPWEATTVLLVPPQNQSILEVGKTLYVRVDPSNPAEVVLDTG